MTEPILKSSPVKVICESCRQEPDSSCLICRGQRFYLWDPQSLLCYYVDGTQLLAVGEDGQQHPVTRQSTTAPGPATIDVNTMLEFIELWVSESPVRKWKLSFDENGWQGCIWFNRYKKSCFQSEDRNLSACISKAYTEIAKHSSVE